MKNSLNIQIQRIEATNSKTPPLPRNPNIYESFPAHSLVFSAIPIYIIDIGARTQIFMVI